MGAVQQAVQNSTGQTITTTTETAIVTSSPMTINAPGAQGVTISGVVNVAVAASTTSVVLRIRNGVGVAGTQLVAITTTVTASTTVTIPYYWVDSTAQVLPGGVPNIQYTLTIVCTAAGANSTVNLVNMEVASVTAAF